MVLKASCIWGSSGPLKSDPQKWLSIENQNKILENIKVDHEKSFGFKSNLEPNCSVHTCQDMDKGIGKGKERELQHYSITFSAKINPNENLSLNEQ